MNNNTTSIAGAAPTWGVPADPLLRWPDNVPVHAALGLVTAALVAPAAWACVEREADGARSALVAVFLFLALVLAAGAGDPWPRAGTGHTFAALVASLLTVAALGLLVRRRVTLARVALGLSVLGAWPAAVLTGVDDMFGLRDARLSRTQTWGHFGMGWLLAMAACGYGWVAMRQGGVPGRAGLWAENLFVGGAGAAFLVGTLITDWPYDTNTGQHLAMGCGVLAAGAAGVVQLRRQLPGFESAWVRRGGSTAAGAAAFAAMIVMHHQFNRLGWLLHAWAAAALLGTACLRAAAAFGAVSNVLLLGAFLLAASQRGVVVLWQEFYSDDITASGLALTVAAAAQAAWLLGRGWLRATRPEYY